MYNNYADSFHYPDVFRLNMQMIFDILSKDFPKLDKSFNSDIQCLTCIHCYQPQMSLCEHYLYLASAEQLPENFTFQANQHFLIIGSNKYSALPKGCCIIQASPEYDFIALLNCCQNIFEKLLSWDVQLRNALYSEEPINALVEVSLGIFNNPVFVHDTNFYILSCPHHSAGMSVWVRDRKTGRLMVPLSLINEFKFDLEYLFTLGVHGSSMFSQNVRGYRILYRNLWEDHKYRGRICINELDSTIMPSHYTLLEHLGQFTEYCFRQHALFSKSAGMDIDDFFVRFASGDYKDENELFTGMEYMNWNQHDTYICLRMESDSNYQDMTISATTISHIEARIPDGIAFVYQNAINIVVNLSTYKSSSANVISSLAIIMREGLYKMGTSYEFNDFLNIPQAIFQAKAALRLGKKSGSMIWCHRFDQHLLDYILDVSTSDISPEMLYSRHLLTLQEYDKENNTDLFHTLEVYLTLERNVLQTAKQLFVHRSTLFYRLERIQKLTKLNLDDPEQRLCLLLSFAMLQDSPHKD